MKSGTRLQKQWQLQKALEGNQRAFNVQDLNDSVAAAAASGGEATAKMSFVQETAGSLENDQHSTDAYKMAWAKTMMGENSYCKRNRDHGKSKCIYPYN